MSSFSIKFKNNKEIKLNFNDKVWSPYSAPTLINQYTKIGLDHLIANKKVLDMSSGTGILGIWAALCGADEVIMTDLSHDAVILSNKNAMLNNVSRNCLAINSDRFNSIRTHKFDIIISNPPVQPWLFANDKLATRPNASSWNESGNNGRLVLDSLIQEGSNYLKNDKSIIILTHSSRHGLELTEKKLTNNWKKNWSHINKFIYEIDQFHFPYLGIWKDMEKNDGMKRLYSSQEIIDLINKDKSYVLKVSNLMEKTESQFFSYNITAVGDINQLNLSTTH